MCFVMTNFTLRVDDELIRQVDKLAQIHNMSRTAYIVYLLEEAVDAGFAPVRDGEGYRGVTETGGEITLIRHNRYVSGGIHCLSNAELAAFEKAKQIVTPAAGNRWREARHILEEAGFKIYKL